MSIIDSRFDELIQILYEKGLEEKEMTAHEIFKILEDKNLFSSPHEIATILGRNSKDIRIKIIDGYPNKYKIRKTGPT